MALKDIIITGSIGTYPTLSYGQKEYVSSTDEQSFPIEQVTGSSGGATPNFYGQYTTTDLYVNVTQSWDVYDDTPVGIVLSVHDTQDEFINGEYSGSALEVTNQSLIDVDCEQFLTVSTVEIGYKPYLYFYPIFTTQPTPLGNFLDSNTAPKNGEVYLYFEFEAYLPSRQGVTYIKISRNDYQGNDNTLSLQELTNLRLKYSDVVNVADYHVLTITEYPTYYLYSVIPNLTVSVADNNILDHNISAAKSGTTSILGDSYNIVTNYTSVTVNPLSYFDATTGLITFGDTPNAKIDVTASVTVPDQYQDFSLFGSSEGRIAIVNSITGGTLTLSASILPIENSTYWLTIEQNVSGVSSYSNVQFDVSQSAYGTIPNTSINLTVLEPYLLSNFTNSDCDVLMNNADGLEYDINFMSVNYDGNGGSVIPSNQQEILNNTAERAPVKPYNYSALAQILPRYDGVRVIQQSPYLNRNPFTNQLYFTGNYTWTPGDISPDKTPSVNQTTTYFAYFNSLKSNNPIYKDTSSPVVKYLIGEDGTTFNPATDDITYFNTLYSFPKTSKAYTNLLYNNTTTFNSTQSILLSGESYTPILYNLKEYYGNVANWTGSLTFTNIVGGYTATPPDFNFYKISNVGPSNLLHQLFLFNSWNPSILTGIFKSIWMTPGNYVVSTDFSLPAGGTKINLTSAEINPYYYGTGSSALYPYNATTMDGWGPNDGTWVQDIDTISNPDPITGSYYEFTTIPQSSVNFKFSTYVAQRTSFYQTPYTSLSTVSFRLKAYYKRGSTVTLLGYKDYNTISTIENSYYLEVLGFFPQLNDKVFFTVENIGITPVCINVYNNAGGNGYSRFEITTNQDVGTITDVPYFWSTGSDNSTTITSSIQLGAALQGNFKQSDITSSGFDPIQSAATIEVGDEFRFEYDENNTFTVISSSIYSSGSGLACSVTFDKFIPTSPNLDINHFTVRRKVKDYITGITLDNNLITPISGGFLLPENPSDGIKNNMPKIITNLFERNKI